MTKRRHIKNAALLVCCLLFVFAALPGCAKGAVTTGAFDGQTYGNEFFGLSLTVPADWRIALKDEMQRQFGVDKAQVGSDDKQVEQELKLGEQKTLYLLYVSEFPQGHVGSFNSNIILTCENLKLTGQKVKTAKEYLLAAADKIDKELYSYQLDEIDEENIGPVKVATAYAELEINGIPLRQRHFAALRNGYALLMTQTYSREATVDELNEMQGIANSLMFK